MLHMFFCFFFFNDTATTEIYTLSLHDALPIWFEPHAARYFFISCDQVAGGDVPGKLLGLLVATFLHLFSQRLIEQHAMQRVHDFKNILWIHHDSCITNYLG